MISNTHAYLGKKKPKTLSFEISYMHIIDHWIKLHMHKGVVQFQFHNVLSWDVNRVAAANNVLKGVSKDHKGDHHILLNLVMHSLIDYIGKSPYMIIQIKTAAVLSIALQTVTYCSQCWLPELSD